MSRFLDPYHPPDYCSHHIQIATSPPLTLVLHSLCPDCYIPTTHLSAALTMSRLLHPFHPPECRTDYIQIAPFLPPS
ncbi:hypothetical protein PoB_006155700 [Plakobranchus ocellatus]|uniref:Uncharacterized protein n=1 Tax=Plakobranchus ocellatus TaxID=259542 RepID=A0AAV4CT38_9GAST|nr:hypothetical protein PoB_006155700 [Plakobranchus ocellatus]